jgi:hypothetical protein
MGAILSWASSQPVWAQVVIGLTLFIVGIPLLLFVLYGALVLLRGLLVETLPLAFKLVFGVVALGAVLSLPWALWAGALHLVGLAMHQLEVSSSVVPQELGALLLLAATVTPVLYGAYRWQAPIRAHIRRWREQGECE